MADEATPTESTEDTGTARSEETQERSEGDKTFTQSQVNTLLADQKRKVREQFADYDDLKTKATLLDGLTEERDALKAERDTLKGDSEKVVGENLRLTVALDKRLPAPLIDRLRGTSKEELEADADSLLKLVKANGSGFDGGPRDTPPAEQNLASWLQSHISGDQQ